jgi:phosphatidylinositol alpha-1,6-mannosyltransferase
MKNICYLNLVTFSNTGGIENFNKTFLKALSHLNNGKTISISIYDKPADGNAFDGVESHNFNGNKFNAIKFLISRLRKIDILILAHVNLIPVALIAKILKPSLKVYLSIYGIDVWKKLPFFYRYILKNATIFSISTYTTETFMKFNPFIKKEQIVYLPPDTDINIKSSLENPYQLNEYNLLTVSRLDSNDSYKGIDSIIKTLPLLTEKIPNIKYTVIGKGNDKERLVDLVNKLDVQKHVEFKGFVEQIEPYYKYCDVFTLPSKGEGFGIVYIEAMKYHKPCIACNTGGATDVVLDTKTGFLCEYDDQECLAEKFLDLYHKRDLAIEFGKNGYKHLVENFTFERFKNRLSIALGEKEL